MVDTASIKIVRIGDVSRVPREFIGRARDLRRRLNEADARIETAVNRVMTPLLRRLDRRPALRPAMLIDAERHWRGIVPAFGRLEMEVDGNNLRSPCFVELRVVCGESRYADWSDNGLEPGVLVAWYSVEVAERAFESRLVSLASVSLHALARRYQRGQDTTEAAIFADLAALARDFRAVTSPRFTVAVPGGVWVGESVNVDAAQILAVRTYYDADCDASALAERADQHPCLEQGAGGDRIPSTGRASGD